MLALVAGDETLPIGWPSAAPVNLDTASANMPAGTTLARATVPARNGSHSSAANDNPKFFFGFLEFDWDPNAPGGVPGFGPWP
jgi:hypothetical protein